VRIYSESSEEALRARKLLKQWDADGSLSKEQYQLLEKETVSDLRTTNIFLRLVFFFFTMIGIAAVVALFFVGGVPHSSDQTGGTFLLIFAAVSYTAVEVVVAQARLYRYGIEESFAICSVAFLCVGVAVFFFGSRDSSHGIELAVPAVGAITSLWIWYRLNLWYAFPAAMIFAIFLPLHWDPSPSTQHAFIAVIYAAGLICIALIRSRHRFDYLENSYSLSEAFLWLGIYLVFNLKVLALTWPTQWWGFNSWIDPEFAVRFYWTTWVLIWCLPPLILVRGIRQKDRFIIAVGAITAILTLATNKPYLGWRRHTWDPILLGIVLTGVSVFLRRWLAQGPGGVRHGFTAAGLSAKDKHTMSVGSAVLGLITPQAITPPSQSPSPQPAAPDSAFGGASGGGGASGDF
jgi:hypothetical protein